MSKATFIIALVFSWVYMDMESTDTFEGLILPLLFGILLIVAICKMAFYLGFDKGGPGEGGDGDSGCGGGE